MIEVGVAICDKVMDEYTLAKVVGGVYNSKRLEKLDFGAIELQLERWGGYGIFLGGGDVSSFIRQRVLEKRDGLLERALFELGQKKFKSVHGPIWSGNLSSPEESVRKQAIETTKKAMNVADAFGANIFVLHPCRFDFDDWQRFKGKVGNYMGFRELTQGIFLGNLEELARYYAERDFDFRVGIENIEFNQFPATVEELFVLLERSNEIWQRINPNREKMGVVLDIQHLRHSKTILKENLPQPLEYFMNGIAFERLRQYAHAPTCREYDFVPLEGTPFPVINGLFRDHLNDIILIHLAGNNDRHATHDPILYDLRTFNYGKYHYDLGVLNMRQVLDIIYFSGYQGAIILEVRSSKELFEERFGEHITTLDNVKTYFNYLAGKNGGEQRRIL